MPNLDQTQSEQPTKFSNELVAIKVTEMAAKALLHYPSNPEKAAMRCALGDAAAVCDILARVIVEEGRGRNGRVRKKFREAAKIAKRCGDDIWLMRMTLT